MNIITDKIPTIREILLDNIKVIVNNNIINFGEPASLVNRVERDLNCIVPVLCEGFDYDISVISTLYDITCIISLDISGHHGDPIFVYLNIEWSNPIAEYESVYGL